VDGRVVSSGVVRGDLSFYAYINELHSSRCKIPSKNIVRQRCAEEFNFGVKGLNKFLSLKHLSWIE
jgi:hypothetical protein